MFLTHDLIEKWGLSAGDETFSFGRYVDLGGRDENQPVARFGNVARLYGDPIMQLGRSYLQESFVVESRSLSGYSGSPVFVYPGPDPGGTSDGGVVLHTLTAAHCWLLGVCWGHHPWTEKVRDPNVQGSPIVTPERVVQITSGLMMVVPAWKLGELLDCNEFVEMRMRVEEAHVQGT